MYFFAVEGFDSTALFVFESNLLDSNSSFILTANLLLHVAMARMLNKDLNISCLFIRVCVIHRVHIKKNFIFMIIITVKIIDVSMEKSCESETKRTPQNKVAAPAVIASISSLLLSSFL